MFGSRLSLNPYLQILCKGCRLLETQCLVRKESAIQLLETNPLLLHSSFEDLERCATKGCSVCRVIRKGFLRECYSRDQEELLLRGSTGGVFTKFTSIAAVGNRSSPGLIFIAKLKVTETRSFEATIDLTVSNDLVSIAPHAHDPIVYQKAKQWLLDCAEQHFECTEEMEIGDPPYNPTRLLDIGDYSSSPIRLITSPQKLVMYCALSYCWGEEGSSLSTTRGNIQEHEQNIPLKKFSGTLLDFITVSQKLGIRFVWIDALRIIQYDAEDFARESALMHQVYSHAIMTVSVCSSKSSAEQFLIPRRAETLQLEKVVFSGSRLSLRPKTLEQIRKWSPLMKRAWTFQEEILSPRVLYRTDHGLFWNCTLKQYAEHDAWAPLPPRERHTDWAHTIEAYSSRLLSHREDRLIALAGVAAMI